MNAREYLKELQLRQLGPAATGNSYDQRTRRYHLDLINRAKPALRKFMEENLRRLDAADAKYFDRLPTPFQSMQDFRRLAGAKDRIDVMLRRRRGSEFEPPDLVLGSIETEKLNAMSAPRTKSGEHLIVFNRGLLLALLVASEHVVWALKIDRRRALRSGVEKIEEDKVELLAPRFAEMLESVSQGRMREPKITLPSLVEKSKLKAWRKQWLKTGKFGQQQRLEDVAMGFVLAHEYAHVLLGHLSGAAGQELSEDRGGWGQEYEADRIALGFVTRAFLDEVQIDSGSNEDNPFVHAFLLQGVCLFFTMICQIEQYRAEVLGKSAGIWSASKSHPPTFIRWLRMIDQARRHTPNGIWTSVIAPSLNTIDRCLSLYYAASVGPRVPRTPAGLEWHFQRRALEAHGAFPSVPQHLFIASRCARAALDCGAPLSEIQVANHALEADEELKADGARPLRDYRHPLPTFAHGLSELALSIAQIAGAEVDVRKFADRLADIFLLDARTRYPLVASAD